jgi:hypothetical protein
MLVILSTSLIRCMSWLYYEEEQTYCEQHPLGLLKNTLLHGLIFFSVDVFWGLSSSSNAFLFSTANRDSAQEPYDYVIKRVIALEGDTVRSHLHHPVRVRIPEG